MNYSAQQDIAAPHDFVFRALSDFAAHERAALRRGIDVTRTGGMSTTAPEPPQGLSWRVSFKLRGKPQVLDLCLETCDPSGKLLFTGATKALSGSLSMDLVALSRRQSRLAVGLELTPLTIAARLTLQSAKLARRRIEDRLKTRLRDDARALEARYEKARLNDAATAGADRPGRPPATSSTR